MLKPAEGSRPESHLSFEIPLDLFPVERVEVEIHQLLGYLGLDVLTKLFPELLHGKLFRQAGFQLRGRSIRVRKRKRWAKVLKIGNYRVRCGGLLEKTFPTSKRHASYASAGAPASCVLRW